MKNPTSLLLLVTLFLWSSSILFGQNQFSENWVVIAEKSGVSIQLKKVKCLDSANGVFYNNALLRIVNSTRQKQQVSWVPAKWVDGEAIEIDPEEERVSIIVKSKREVVGECNAKPLCEYVSFIDKPEVASLTRYEVTNLEVEPVKFWP